jgi:hypothetical protein
LVFSIRRHKLDDYRGRYGLWLWAMFVCLIASIDSTASLHQVVRGTLVALTGTPLVGDGSVWWVGCGVCLFGIVAIRVFLDMRACPGACVALGLGVNCYLLATMTHLGFLHVIDDVVTVMLHSTSLLLGHLMLLFSFLVYSRYVFLDAQGQIASTDATRQARRGRRFGLLAFARREAATESAADQDGAKATSSCSSASGNKLATSETPPERTSAPAAKLTARSTPTSKSSQPTLQVRKSDSEGAGDTTQEPDISLLSKAERRRLRKLQRRQKRAA